MVSGARGRSAKVEIQVYPGAHHDFDHPNRPVQVRTGLAFSVDGSGRGHTGTDPVARADALKRVPAFLAR
jgi:dienelactone hydrolase